MMAASRNAVFFGSKALGHAVLSRLLTAHDGLSWTIVHPDDVDDPRSCLDSFRTLALENGAEFHVVGSQTESRALIASASPDIGFVCGWYWLFSAADIAAFRRGLWGIHNSLLPKFRGGAPLVWSIMAGEKEVGSSVFRISTGMDDGEILLRVRVALGPDDDVGDALARIEAGLVAVIRDRWRALVDGNVPLSVQDETQASWCGQRSDADGCIDWSRPAPVLHDFIRAQAPPYPCAWSELDDQRLRIVRARPVAGRYFGTAGQVLRRLDSSVLVACGDNTALELLSVRREGETTSVSPASVIRSIKARLGISDRSPREPRPPR